MFYDLNNRQLVLEILREPQDDITLILKGMICRLKKLFQFKLTASINCQAKFSKSRYYLCTITCKNPGLICRRFFPTQKHANPFGCS